MDAGLPIVFILFQNLEAFLPTSVSDLGNNTRGASTVVSIQVGERRTPQRSPLLEKYPISLNFTFDKVNFNVNNTTISVSDIDTIKPVY